MLTKADIQLIRSLGDKAARTEHGLFTVEGEKMAVEAMHSSFETVRLLVTAQSRITSAAAETVSEKEMERISALKTPSTALAVMRIPHRRQCTLAPSELVLALDDIQDPGNLGTIIRIADWFGITKIVCSAATADCFNPKVVQATMGALFRVELFYGDLAAWLTDAAKAGATIYGTTLNGDCIYDTALTEGGVIVMGNEGNGVSAPVKALLNKELLIPPYPAGRHGSESLNVATATAIVCSEFRRRRR